MNLSLLNDSGQPLLTSNSSLKSLFLMWYPSIGMISHLFPISSTISFTILATVDFPDPFQNIHPWIQFKNNHIMESLKPGGPANPIHNWTPSSCDWRVVVIKSRILISKSSIFNLRISWTFEWQKSSKILTQNAEISFKTTLRKHSSFHIKYTSYLTHLKLKR